MSDVLTLEQAADGLGVSAKTVRRWIAAGELRASHLARGRWAIRREDLDAFLDARATGGTTQPAPRPVHAAPAPLPARPSRRQQPGRLVAPRRAA